MFNNELDEKQLSYALMYISILIIQCKVYDLFFFFINHRMIIKKMERTLKMTVDFFNSL